MDKQRAAQGPDGTYDIKESLKFAYKALSKELYVGEVYLRVYNDQPDFEISEPESFCVALVEFVSSLVHYDCADDADIPSNSNSSSPSPEMLDGQEDASNGSVDGQHDDAGSMVTEGNVADKEENVLIKNLQFGLTSLKVMFVSFFLKKMPMFDFGMI